VATCRPGGKVVKAEFSPDGQFVVTVSTQGSEAIATMCDRTGTVIMKRGLERSPIVPDVQISPDNQVLVAGGQDGNLRFYDRQGQVVRVFQGHPGEIYAIAFSPDGQKLATIGNHAIAGSRDDRVRVWDRQERYWRKPPFADLNIRWNLARMGRRSPFQKPLSSI